MPTAAKILGKNFLLLGGARFFSVADAMEALRQSGQTHEAKPAGLGELKLLQQFVAQTAGDSGSPTAWESCHHMLRVVAPAGRTFFKKGKRCYPVLCVPAVTERSAAHIEWWTTPPPDSLVLFTLEKG